MDITSPQRRLWSLFEPVHVVTYFAPAATAAFQAAGLRGYWRGYFAGRAAPLGAVGSGPVIAAFFGFAPGMVTRALPDVWTRITPADALVARAAGARAALESVLGEAELDEVAELLAAAAQAVELPGRVLAAANADLPWPADAIDRLWHAATILREHRGDGHVAALLTAGLDGCESLVWRAALHGGNLRAIFQQARGWTDPEWEAATDRLRDRGWVGADGTATEAGWAGYRDVEAVTDRLAAGPWQQLGEKGTERCAELLGPLAARIRPLIPAENPMPLVDGAGPAEPR
ncbi:MAG: hypothetical protein ABW046_09625 [Actinoplanes sp.]